MGKVYIRKYLLGSNFRYHVKLPSVDWVAHRALLIQTNSLKKFNRDCFFWRVTTIYLFLLWSYTSKVCCVR